MPVVTIDIIEDVFSPAEKGEMIRAVTDAVVGVEGESMRGVTFVRINETRQADWAIGGELLRADDVKRMRAAETP